jgi:hypothetical protein
MAQRADNNENVTRNRWVSFAWVIGIAAVIITCLILQQSALLYVLSTLGVAILLIVVARADLSGSNVEREAGS